MVKLKIFKAGLYLTLPGLPAVRTPVEIDITKVNINLIIGSLKQHGITEYTIVSEPEGKIKPKKSKPKKKKVEKKPTNIDNRLDRIEKMITSLTLTSFQMVEDPVNKQAIIKPKKDEEEHEAFIPSIDTEGLNSSISSEEGGEIDDVSEQADMLAKLQGDKK